MKNSILTKLLVIISLSTIAVTGHAGTVAESSTSWLIENVLIVDGSGAEGTPGSVRIAGPNIVATGDLRALEGERVINGGGQVLAPGFIDTHSHADSEIEERRDALAAVGQGITTVVVGQDGGSPFPLSDWFTVMEKAPAAVNVASYAGHNTLRDEVMGEDFRRVATPGEVETMSSLLQRELDSGALGLSIGLEYEPGIHSEPSEVLTLARVAAAAKSRYTSHVRSEDRWFWRAIDEIIEIGRVTGMPVQVTHMKLAMKSSWGKAAELIGKLDAARAEGIDITADVYPYEYWQSNMMVLIPSRDLGAREEYEFALSEIAPPEGFWLTQFDPQPEYVGKKLTEIADLRGVDPVTALMQLTAESVAFETENGSNADTMIGTSMIEEDIQALLAWPHTVVCTDGSLDDLHPRGTGTFPRVLGRYVREGSLMNLEEAIHKMTGLSAAHMGFTKRGLIKPGMAADLVLFDPGTVIDNATPENPQTPNSGISTVWVNGEIVFENGTSTGRYPGRVIRRKDS
jgi:N-acyl-D-amino-acid deacylase